MDLYTKLLLGSYAFTAGCFVWAWVLYSRVVQLVLTERHSIEERVERVEDRLNNHVPHQIEALKDRVQRLEDA